MKKKKIGYILVVIIAFVFGMQLNINEETSPSISSDVIAVINNDQKAEYLDGTLKIGDDFIKFLQREENDNNYIITNETDADLGLANGTYGASITIPSNLTTSVLSVNQEKPTQSSLVYNLNPKLSPKDSEKIEDEIIDNIQEFESNITYMFVYSMFDEVHTTQEGVETVIGNNQSVFSFLKEVQGINVTENHEYELEDNNTDSFSKIDIAAQLTDFRSTVEDYQYNVSNVIEVYKEENNQFSILADNSIYKMNENDKLLNDRINNVESTLEEVVKANEQYTDEEYSITNSKSNITDIIQGYLNQLQITNNLIDQNSATLSDVEKVNENRDRLLENQQYQEISSLLDNRIVYYSELDAIVQECFTKDESEAKECIDSKLSNYKGSYGNYYKQISQLREEQNYYDTMTYYLENLGVDGDGELESQAPITISEEIVEVAKPEILSEVAVNPQLTATSFGPSGVVGTSVDTDLVALKVTNARDLDSITIKLKNLQNIQNISHLSTGLDNSKVKIYEDNIRISGIAASELNLLFSVERGDQLLDASFDLEYKDMVTTVDLGGASPLTASGEINSSNELLINYNYVIQEDNEIVEYKNSSLISEYGVSHFNFENDAEGRVTASLTGFIIDGTGLSAGEQLSFTVKIENQLKSGLLFETYNISDQKYSFPIINDQISLSTRLSVKDDPYYVLDGKIGNDDDDIDQNKLIEPQEQVGIKYSLAIESEYVYPITSIEFQAELPPAVFESINSQDIKVAINGSILSPIINVTNGNVNLNFSPPLEILPGTDQSELNLDIYINTITLDNINLDSRTEQLQMYFTDLKIKSGSTEYNTLNSASTKIKLALGNPTLESVEYIVDANSCSGSKNISQCKFEAGEDITKKIVISNNSDEPLAGVVLTDMLENTDSMNQSKDVEIQLEASSVEDPNAYRDEKIWIDSEDKIHASLPAQSQLTITKTINIGAEIYDQTTVTNDLELYQYNQKLSRSSSELIIIPIELAVSIIEDEQAVEDGVITPNEAVDISVEIKNTSKRGISSLHGIKLLESDSSTIEYFKVISVEDKNWDPVSYEKSGNNAIKIDSLLNPGDSFRIKIRVKFNELPGNSTQDLSFISYTGIFEEERVTCNKDNCDTISYNLAVNPDYFQLAKDHATQTTVWGDDTYKTSLDKSVEVSEIQTNLHTIINNLNEYIGDYQEYNTNLDAFTVLDNTEIAEINDAISMYSLGFENEEDEDKLANYYYCQSEDNHELSCQMFGLYNKIVTSETAAKSHLQTNLTLVDPRVKESLGDKETDSDEVNPINVGADFNGYGECQVDEDQELDQVCESLEPGINERIKIQKDNVKEVENNIDLILTNETMPIDEEPYKDRLVEINESTNQVMTETETANNELFTEKVEIYDENYKRVMEYIQAVNEDETLQDAVETFKKEETTRQLESTEILESVYNLMPNTNLGGMPNQLVYSFISDPFELHKNQDLEQVNAVPTSTPNRLLIAVISFTGILIVLILSYYWINKEE